jgi:hypothetical protein
MSNVSPERLQHTLNIVGGAEQGDDGRERRQRPAFSGAAVTGGCGDGVRNLGTSGVDGVALVFVPHVTCDFKVAAGDAVAAVDDVAVAGDKALAVALTSTTVGATVPATLSVLDPSSVHTGHLVNGRSGGPSPTTRSRCSSASS